MKYSLVVQFQHFCGQDVVSALHSAQEIAP